MDRQNIQQNRTKLKPNDSIQYKTPNSDESIKATVQGRAGKATGKNKHWFNIQEKASKENKSVNLEQIQWVLINDDDTVNLVTRQNNDDTTTVKLVELQKLSQFHTYDEVKDCGQQTLSTRWVITNKEGQTKARLVVSGFEEEFTMPRDSLTVGKGTMRIFLAIASIQKWTAKTTDTKSAFLQGRELRRDVYIKPPKE